MKIVHRYHLFVEKSRHKDEVEATDKSECRKSVGK